jgi:hypothetical protein
LAAGAVAQPRQPAQPPNGDEPADCGELEAQPAESSAQLLKLARCHESAGKTATAFAEYKKAAARGKEGDAERVRQASKAADALEPRLSKLTIELAAQPIGLEVRRNGVVVPREHFHLAVPVDPGEHRIEASAPRHVSWSTTLTIGSQGDAQALSIPALAPDEPPPTLPPPALAAPPPHPPAPPPPPPPPVEEGMRDAMLAGIALGALGGVTLVVGAVLGGMALSKTSAAEERCPNRACGPDVAAADVRDDIRPLADGATVALVLGGATAAFGIVLLVADGVGSEEVALTVDGGPSSLGLGVRGGF